APIAVGNSANWLNFGSGLTFVASGVLYVVGVIPGLPVHAVESLGPELGASSAAGLLGGSAPRLGSTGGSMGGGPTGVLAGLGRAASIGGLSVPQTWAWAAPAITRAATALPEATLVGLSEAAADGLGPWSGGMLPAGLMAAAAGGGGAAGGSWA